MATSGTYSFMMVGNDLISAALRLTGRFDPYDAIPTTDMTNVQQALEVLLKELAIDGLPLWKVQTVTVPMIAGQATYNLSTLSGSTLPLRILQAIIRDSAGNDVELTNESRYDYNLLGAKTAQGVPNQYFYDPQLGSGVMTLYDTPADTTHTVYVTIQQQIMDLTLGTNNVDFPQEAYRMLKWCLFDEISLEYNTPAQKRAEGAARASGLRKEFFASQQEQTSIFLIPSDRSR